MSGYSYKSRSGSRDEKAGFRGTGVPASVARKAFELGSVEEIFAKAIEKVDAVDADLIKQLENIKQAEKLYNQLEGQNERDAILIKWMMLCETKQELANPTIRAQRKSLAEAVSIQMI